MTWEKRLNTQCTVPQSAMVSADITDINNAVQPRLKNAVAYSIKIGDFTFRDAWSQKVYIAMTAFQMKLLPLSSTLVEMDYHIML